MKIRFVISGAAILFAGIVFSACSDSDGGSSSRSELLSSPPYAGLTDSIRQHPEDASLYLRRATRLSQNSEHQAATADYEKAWDLNPSDATGMEYASNLLLTDHTSDAIDFLKQCIKQFPANTEFRRRLSEVYAQHGMLQEAVAQYDKMLEADPENFLAYYYRGMLQARMRDTAAAIHSLEKSFSLQPLMYTGLELANIYASSRNAKAVTICDELLKRDSAEGTTDASYIKGTYYFNVGRFAEAIKQYDETIRRDWNFVDAYLDKGIILHEQKKYKEALDVFSKAALVANTNPDAYYWLGRTYESMGQKDEAIENYQRTLSLDRSFREAREHLDELSR